VQAVGHRHRKLGIVDVRVDLVHLDPVVERLAQPAQDRRIRLGIVERPPSTAIADTPRSGMKSAVGPRAADSLRPRMRPSSSHSSGVVRISVTVGLCT